MPGDLLRLHEAIQGCRNRLISLGHGSSRPDSDIGFWTGYLETQAKCVKALEQVTADLGKESLLDRRCLFLCGSLARLEYVPGISDADFFAVARKRRLPLKEDGDAFQVLAGRVKESMQKRFRDLHDASGAEELKVEVSGIPARPHTLFWTRSELCEQAGKAYEAAWACGERGALLFEAACLGSDERLRLVLTERVWNLYGYGEDVVQDRFPFLAGTFSRLLLASGAVAKIGHVRNGSDVADLGDSPHAKVLVARVWNAMINILIMHLVYWKCLVSEEYRPNRAALKTTVCNPPIYKVMQTIPMLMRGLAHKLRKHASKELGEDDWKEVEKHLKSIQPHLVARLTGRLTLMKMLTGLFQWHRKARTNNVQSRASALSQAKEHTETLLSITTRAARITMLLQAREIGRSPRDAYDRVWLLTGMSLFPESGGPIGMD